MWIGHVECPKIIRKLFLPMLGFKLKQSRCSLAQQQGATLKLDGPELHHRPLTMVMVVGPLSAGRVRQSHSLAQ